MITNKEAKPILKWAGGKTQVLPEIIKRLPVGFQSMKRYVEPFIGAGAVFFYLVNNDCFEEYFINDINGKLINLYNIIRDNCDTLIDELNNMKIEYLEVDDLEEKEKVYYKFRDEFNGNECSRVRMAALFIVINKTCFNGLYRENLKGGFNVPFGKQKNPGIFFEDDIRAMEEKFNLKNNKGDFKVKILNTTFDKLEEYVDNNTFVYLDPPYRPVTVGGFNSYSKSGFNDDNQRELANFFKVLDKKGAKLILSNSDPKNLDAEDEFFDELYKGFNIERISVSRMINSKGDSRGSISELLITNNDRGDASVDISYKKDKDTFNYLLDTLKDSIKGWDYFVNWDKVNKNVKDIEIQLNILNYLIGKENIVEEAKFLINEHPGVVKAIPILLACRENNFQIILSDEENMFKSKLYMFKNTKQLTSEEVDNIVEFMEESKILDLFRNKTIKNVVDYVFGVEVGLDSNGRKNRSGHAMEDIVEKFVDKLCKENGFKYLKEANPKVIEKEWGYNVTVDKSARRFDFVINTGEKLYLIETNYYGGGGSKLKSTAGEYKTLFDIASKDGHEFVWITDGKGWLTASRPLEETFNHNNYIVNLTMLENGILNEIINNN